MLRELRIKNFAVIDEVVLDLGPGLNIMDAGFFKRFRLGGERRLLTFRVELFNALNHPNWANPEINISNVNTAATITDISKPMRQAQFAVRFDF